MTDRRRARRGFALQHGPSGMPVFVSYLAVDRECFEENEVRVYLAEHLSSGLFPWSVVIDELLLVRAIVESFRIVPVFVSLALGEVVLGGTRTPSFTSASLRRLY